MKRAIVIALLGVIAIPVLGKGIVVQGMRGDVQVRHGVAEVWTAAAVGDVLRPNDTVKTGKKSTATLLVGETQRLTLPQEVIVDMSDVRDLSQEELMLKLTMEKVRASSYQWKKEEMKIPDAAVVHGAERSPSPLPDQNHLEIGRCEWNGTKVLFDNGYYPTSALRAMDVLRRYPPLGEKFENRLFVAEALEKSNLRGEALSEYVNLSTQKNLTPDQQERLQKKISTLRRESKD